MSLKYKILFTVELLHDYYTDGVCNDFTIVPSEETATLLKGQAMLTKSLNNLLIVLVKINDGGQPFIPLDVNKKLSFYLQLQNPDFNNFTNLSYKPSQTRRYYFSNLNKTKIGDTLFLNSKISVYATSNAYAIGNFAATGANDVYEAVKPNDPGNQHALTEQSFWTKKGKFQYVNDSDLIELTSFVYLFKTAPTKNFTVKTFGLNAGGDLFDVPVQDDELSTFTDFKEEIPVRLEKLPPGKYRLEVNGVSKLVYYDSKAAYNNIFGIIEIANNLPSANTFSLFDNQGKPKGSRFTLRFSNRSVIWRYVSRSTDVTAIKDSALTHNFTPLPPNRFISTKPIPMSEKPINTLFLESTALGKVSPLANPPNNRLSVIEKDGNLYYCGELNLNY